MLGNFCSTRNCCGVERPTKRSSQSWELLFGRINELRDHIIHGFFFSGSRTIRNKSPGHLINHAPFTPHTRTSLDFLEERNAENKRNKFFFYAKRDIILFLPFSFFVGHTHNITLTGGTRGKRKPNVQVVLNTSFDVYYYSRVCNVMSSIKFRA
jgi:hypothetical protein